jgi:hypothetical protein
MIRVFITEAEPEQYYETDKSFPFPKPPKGCPFPGCRMNVTLKKHGFYTRNFIKSDFSRRILIRRYI